MDLALRPRPLEESLASLRRFQSRYYGVVREVFDFLHYPDEPSLYTLGCNLCDFLPVLGKNTAGVAAGSYGVNLEDASARSIGEALERYAACFMGARRTVFAAWKDLREPAVHPEEFELFSDRQYNHPEFPYTRFREDLPTTWIEGFELPDMRPVLLPAQLVYLQPDLAAGERRIAYNTSSGIALGSCPAMAVLSGLCEIAERDAFVISWENKLAFPGSDMAGAPAELRAFFAEHFHVPGIRLRVMDYTGFLGVPTAVVTARPERDEGAAFAVGAASAASFSQAVMKATMEVYQTRALAKLLLYEGRERVFKTDFTDIKDFDDHVLYSAKPEHRDVSAFMDSNRAEIPFATENDVATNDPERAIRDLTARYRARGHRVYCVDITTTDLAQAGLTATTTLSPRLARLSIGMGGRFLGVRRLFDEPARLGFRPTPSSIEELNKYPHPFP